jgi:hypothetical protein
MWEGVSAISDPAERPHNVPCSHADVGQKPSQTLVAAWKEERKSMESVLGAGRTIWRAQPVTVTVAGLQRFCLQ